MLPPLPPFDALQKCKQKMEKARSKKLRRPFKAARNPFNQRNGKLRSEPVRKDSNGRASGSIWSNMSHVEIDKVGF